MTKPQTNSINTNQTNRLSVQISLTGLSFLVTSEEGRIVHFSEQKFDAPHTPNELLYEVDSHFIGETALGGRFGNVTLIYTTQNYSLVPAPLFNEKKASEYLKFNTKILGNDYISYDELQNEAIVVVYVPFVNINNYIFERFGSFQYYHSTTLLLSHILKREKHSGDTCVYLHVLEGQFDCIIVSKGKLELCNSYAYKTPEDFIYYVLFCFEQLELNPDTIETVLCGIISVESPLYEILYTYVRHVSFMEVQHPAIGDAKSHEHILLKTRL
ncbi:MAG: DUF3822 family protein [Bacteroidota bacterium]